ncbi:MAG: hypothetical protein SVT52_04685 [Planctomycetota bacterium]|nr:hypothetical protein [Planctomycetota bacterium]
MTTNKTYPRLTIRRRLRRFLCDRTFWSLLLATGLLGTLTGLRNSQRQGLHPRQYDRIKAGWHHCADVVLIGDSRVMCGLSPAAMASQLPGLRILNYGLAGQGLCPEVLDKIEQLLDPQSQRKTIVLGLSPALLRGGIGGIGGEKPKGPQSATDAPAHQRIVRQWFEPLVESLDTMSIQQILQVTFGRTKKRYSLKIYHADGWMETSLVPENRSRALSHYIKRFSDIAVRDGRLLKLLTDRIRRWHSRGIRLYAFRPPTTAKMVALENTLGGFNQDAAVAALTAAGGIWLPVDQTGYHSYDGSHLRYDAARKLSADLAEQIRRAEEAGSR